MNKDSNGKHRSAHEEWAPHKTTGPNAFEWWYFTAPMMGENGHRYFIFLCTFNFNAPMYCVAMKGDYKGEFPEGKIPLVNTVHLCDYDADMYKNGAKEVFVSPDEISDIAKGALLVHYNTKPDSYDIRYEYLGDSFIIKAKTNIFECELHCSGGNRIMWMQDSLEMEGLIREGGKTERSFYYSLPQLPYTGWIKYIDKDGKEVTENVHGEGWVDRQWGNFMTMSWNGQVCALMMVIV